MKFYQFKPLHVNIHVIHNTTEVNEAFIVGYVIQITFASEIHNTM